MDVDLQHEIGVDEVIETLQENGHDAEAGEETGERGYDPVYVDSVATPAKPKQADCE